jgi:hypothetical protein
MAGDEPLSTGAHDARPRRGDVRAPAPSRSDSAAHRGKSVRLPRAARSLSPAWAILPLRTRNLARSAYDPLRSYGKHILWVYEHPRRERRKSIEGMSSSLTEALTASYAQAFMSREGPCIGCRRFIGDIPHSRPRMRGGLQETRLQIPVRFASRIYKKSEMTGRDSCCANLLRMRILFVLTRMGP